ncbi:flagellar motor protein MotB [Paralcaligenes sp. KSB-10]|uniref:flagellar motor protein MotB n=1 Tax=Paralcaligenes sp. KSB-10 TaxID=2901142 RepID=UPI001E400FDB|nr:flagellar motor protein MotB [Paralcaligenes sp. KSB-10]UHL65328.1 flagellar motor protein MotB [Paralcaligenes sp. KSB-10]
MKQSNSDRVVIRRKRAVVAANHGGSWKIAYADFVTAMMSFFLVMWLISLVPSKDLKTIAEYFRMPLMTAVTGGPKVDRGSNVIPGGSPSVIPNKNPLPPRDIRDESLPPGLGGGDDAEGDRRDTRRLEDLKGKLDALIRSDPVLKEFQPQLLLDMTPDGLRIQIIDKQNRPMFTTGSAQVQSYMSAILRELGPVFNELPNSISIAGHTDAQQYAAGDREYSNWELSADRANAARQELVAGGMEALKIKRILGLASSVSLIKDNPNAAVNRRISIVVLNRRAERRIDEQNAAGASAAKLREALESTLLPDPPLPASAAGAASSDGKAAPVRAARESERKAGTSMSGGRQATH